MMEPTLKISPNGTKVWSLNGQWHRDDGPAVEWSTGSTEWYLNGKCHRIDGPAYKGPMHNEWYLNGKFMEFEDWKVEVRKYYDTQEDYLLMLLKL